MTRNQHKRQIRRGRDRMRRDLVHAAGCVYACVVRDCVRNDFAIVNEALVEGIRIPHSIARHWGIR